VSASSMTSDSPVFGHMKGSETTNERTNADK
jgi:hypothetical protein